MNNPLVTIIIINWNGGEALKNCLLSLTKINYKNWELIVVDNGSTDGSLENISKIMPKNVNFKIIENKINLGFAYPCNQAVEKASGKYLLLLNNDTRVTANFLSILVAKMESDESLGIIQPKIFLMDKPGYLDNAGSFFTNTGFLKHWGYMEKDSKEFDSEKIIFSAKGACMLIRMDLVKKIGLFDEDFFAYFEESDFCWRAWIAGFQVLYYPKSQIFHKVGFTTRRQNVQHINYLSFRNRICALIKNLEFLNLLQFLSLHLILSLGGVFVFLVKLQFNHAFTILKAIFWNIINLPKTLEKRSKVQKLRIISDRDLFKKVKKPFDFKKAFGGFARIEEDLKRKV